jgi:protein transport protein SEC61 subunit gamma-like protein
MDVLKKSWKWAWDKSLKGQTKAETKVRNIGHGKWGRVLRMARKPTSEEYSKTLVITAIGIALIGGIGFVIYLVWEYFPEGVDWLFGL